MMTLQTIFASVGTTQRPRHGGTWHVGPGTALKQLTGRLSLWQARIRARRQLRDLCQLDDHTLRDIGLTRAAIRYEAEKPFWRCGSGSLSRRGLK
jgi:uncharacterized protein YjiS (DUF1127 family)